MGRKPLAFLVYFCALGQIACDDDDTGGGGNDTGDVADTGGETGGEDTAEVGEDTGVDTLEEVGEDTGIDTVEEVAEEVGEDVVDEEVVETFLLDRASRGSSLAVNDSGTTLAVANLAAGDVTLFDLTDPEAPDERARVDVGNEPVSVVWHPDNSTLYVVNRASASVSVVLDADSALPNMSDTVLVGSEPGHAALSPTGGRLFVSSWVDGTLTVIDTESNDIIDTVELGGNPYAVCTTHSGDDDESDEYVFVTDFYSRPIDGEPEATDEGREGHLFMVSMDDLSFETVTLEPQEVTIPIPPIVGGVAQPAADFVHHTFANQLYSCVVQGDFVYVTAVGASPEAYDNGTALDRSDDRTDFRQNVHGLVLALDYTADAVVLDEDRTVVLSELVDVQEAPKRFVSVPVDIAFAGETEFGYIASMASDSVQRVDWSPLPDEDVVAGTPDDHFLPVGQSPTGVATFGTTAYTNNEVTRDISVIDLANQNVVTASIASSELPEVDSDEANALIGQRFFNTSLGRWGANGWVGCVACHPFGTTDNVTWVFPAGPRQTVDTSTTFDESGDIQRILNWTAIFDEVHDFELNTRGVSGGTGAIVCDDSLNDNGSANGTAQISFGPAGSPGFSTASTCDRFEGGDAEHQRQDFNFGSTNVLAEEEGTVATADDWDRVEDYLRTVRSPAGHSPTEGDPDVGAGVFLEGGCNNCHGGPLWTVSERYFEPSLNANYTNDLLADEGVGGTGDIASDQVPDDEEFEALAVLEDDGALFRHLCVMRNVDTFDALGPDERGGEEIRLNGAAAQGAFGFNVPSLLNMSTGAPYLHNGAAETLEVLLTDDEFQDHRTAGNQVFTPEGEDLANLIAFLQSIEEPLGADDGTALVDVPAGDDDTGTQGEIDDFVFCPPDGVTDN